MRLVGTVIEKIRPILHFFHISRDFHARLPSHVIPKTDVGNMKETLLQPATNEYSVQSKWTDHKHIQTFFLHGKHSQRRENQALLLKRYLPGKWKTTETAARCYEFSASYFNIISIGRCPLHKMYNKHGH